MGSTQMLPPPSYKELKHPQRLVFTGVVEPLPMDARGQLDM
jgi:hypothetical protein